MLKSKRRRKQIKQFVLNYYREKANRNWDKGLSDYLSDLGLSINEVDYGVVIARKFLDRVQIPGGDIFTLLLDNLDNVLDNGD